MGCPTLLSMATRQAQNNIKLITDLNNMPPSLAMPILEHITDAQQLLDIQTKSPELADHTADLWQKLIKRDISDWEKRWKEPKDPRNWWKVYRKFKREHDEQLLEDERRLASALAQRAEKKVDNSVKFVNVVVPEVKDGDDGDFRWSRVNPYYTGDFTKKKPLTFTQKLMGQSAAASAARQRARQPAAMRAPVSLPKPKQQALKGAGKASAFMTPAAPIMQHTKLLTYLDKNQATMELETAKKRADASRPFIESARTLKATSISPTSSPALPEHRSPVLSPVTPQEVMSSSPVRAVPRPAKRQRESNLFMPPKRVRRE